MINLKAVYNGHEYKAHFVEDKLTLQSKVEVKDWEYKRGAWYKHNIALCDSDVSDLYDVQYMVEYKDSIEQETIWCVNVERPVFLKGNPVNYEVVIDVDHFAKDDSWQNYEKCAAAKVINLQDCKRCFQKTIYQKKDGIVCNTVLEEDLGIEAFRSKVYSFEMDLGERAKLKQQIVRETGCKTAARR